MLAKLKQEIARVGRTASWSWTGFRATWVNEKSLRQWGVINLISAFFVFYLPLSGGERAVLLALGLLILVVELINTAIEETVDFISLERDPRAGRAKDAASAAVAVTAIAGGLAWLVILFS
ncbi:diacylglycerol kinase [Paracoccus aminophilus]|uniref:Diacylglycerol kinase n=1 Tax=Paracoccus aminophilus JCM 7686 TaxID=1367847 RepID=S5XUT4_PARAH|nr:diacylglycerol kinase [Paracoccus aminophilus]AGT11269.1 diacylglycerol kinase [Paracoccus aminophilus JCM 7686]